MKKLMTAMLGLSLLTGVVVLADDPKPTDKKDKKSKPKTPKPAAKKGDKKDEKKGN